MERLNKRSIFEAYKPKILFSEDEQKFALLEQLHYEITGLDCDHLRMKQNHLEADPHTGCDMERFLWYRHVARCSYVFSALQFSFPENKRGPTFESCRDRELFETHVAEMTLKLKDDIDELAEEDVLFPESYLKDIDTAMQLVSVMISASDDEKDLRSTAILIEHHVENYLIGHSKKPHDLNLSELNLQ